MAARCPALRKIDARKPVCPVEGGGVVSDGGAQNESGVHESDRGLARLHESPPWSRITMERRLSARTILSGPGSPGTPACEPWPRVHRAQSSRLREKIVEGAFGGRE